MTKYLILNAKAKISFQLLKRPLKLGDWVYSYKWASVPWRDFPRGWADPAFSRFWRTWPTDWSLSSVNLTV